VNKIAFISTSFLSVDNPVYMRLCTHVGLSTDCCRWKWLRRLGDRLPPAMYNQTAGVCNVSPSALSGSHSPISIIVVKPPLWTWAIWRTRSNCVSQKDFQLACDLHNHCITLCTGSRESIVDIVRDEGDHLNLTCPSRDPVEWRRDKEVGKIFTSDKYAQKLNYLYIRNLTIADADFYKAYHRSSGQLLMQFNVTVRKKGNFFIVSYGCRRLELSSLCLRGLFWPFFCLSVFKSVALLKEMWMILGIFFGKVSLVSGILKWIRIYSRCRIFPTRENIIIYSTAACCWHLPGGVTRALWRYGLSWLAP